MNVPTPIAAIFVGLVLAGLAAAVDDPFLTPLLGYSGLALIVVTVLVTMAVTVAGRIRSRL